MDPELRFYQQTLLFFFPLLLTACVFLALKSFP